MSTTPETLHDDEQVPQFMTAQQLAKRLAVTPRHLYRMADRDAIPHARIGRRVIFPLTGIRAYLDAHTTEATN